MKKYLFFSLAAAGLLVGCGQGDQTTGSTDTSGSAGAPMSEPSGADRTGSLNNGVNSTTNTSLSAPSAGPRNPATGAGSPDGSAQEASGGQGRAPSSSNSQTSGSAGSGQSQ